jgi:hypothetical protein
MRNEAEIEDRTVNILAIIRGNESYMKYWGGRWGVWERDKWK